MGAGAAELNAICRLMSRTEAFLATSMMVHQALPYWGTILDLGCGSGVMLERLMLPTRRLIGIELDAGLVREALDRSYGRFDVNVVRGDVRKLDMLPDGLADGISCCHRLCRLGPGEIGAVLGEARRLLRPGGVMVVTEPGPSFSLQDFFSAAREEFGRKGRADWVAEIDGLGSSQAKDPPALSCFTADELMALLLGAGFYSAEVAAPPVTGGQCIFVRAMF